VTDNESRLTAIETSIDTIKRDISEVKESIKCILNSCPSCRSDVATHNADIRHLREQIAMLKSDIDRQISDLWSRVWLIGGGGIGGGSIIAVVSWLLRGG